MLFKTGPAPFQCIPSLVMSKKSSGKKVKAQKDTAKKPSPERAAQPAATSADEPRAKSAAGGRRIQVRRSGVHGKGVFARVPIEKGETLIEYIGEIITWKQALKRHPHDPNDPHHTFYFHIDDKHVIDALHGGNASRWINHSCKPNCEADQQGKRVFIKSIKRIEPGEELFYDYGLVIDGKLTKKLKRQYACHCGSKKCRGTMLSASV